MCNACNTKAICKIKKICHIVRKEGYKFFLQSVMSTFSQNN